MPTRQKPEQETDTPARISTHQMRQMHALLRDHGITGDKAVHDYLTLALDREVESRTTITTVEAARVITDLEAAQVHHVLGEARLAALRAPFHGEAIGKLPRSTCKGCSDNRGTCERHPRKATCGVCRNYHNADPAAVMHIDYVGHADVTARLLEVDPEWTWTFIAQDPNGFPILDGNGGLWMNLTVLGVTRPGYGDPGKNKGRPEGMKEAIGDALRNAAMRFGVALDLWAKGDRDWAQTEKHGAEDTHPDAAAPRQDTPAEPYTGPTTAALLEQIDRDAARAGVTYEQATKKWREARGLDLDALETVDPWHIAPLAQAVKDRADQIEAEKAAEAEKPEGQDEALPDPADGKDPWAAPGA